MEHKKKIPFLPRKIALITSPTGAVVHDMIHILRRRFENVEILILPCRVQGKEAVNELVEAFQAVDSLEDVDVTILARGGGSLEDLIAFNSEELARAIFASKVPVISAVGHETDYTIADFVADLRAPTPSAAAELAAPVKMELKKSCDAALNGISIRMLRCISDCRSRLNHRRERMVHPRKRIEDHLLRLDDVASRMERTLSGILSVRREHLGWKVEKLSASSTDKLVEKLKVKLENLNYKYNSLMKIYLKNKRFKVQEKTSKLAALDPAAVLARGYSITRLLPGKTILHEAECVPVDAHVEITLNKGMLFCRVEGKKSNEQKNDV